MPGTVAGLLGSALLYRGATGHCDVYGALSRSTAGPRPMVRIREAFTVEASAEDLFRQWRQLETLPLFMKHLQSVKRTGPLESHWVARATGGKTIEWDARITAEEEDRFLAWESLPGSQVSHSGSVRFLPSPGNRGTIVDVDITYAPLRGRLPAAMAALFGKAAEQQIRTDLRGFKQLMEAGELPTTEGQPVGHRKETSPPAEAGRKSLEAMWLERELAGHQR